MTALCKCGCGQPAPVPTVNNRSKGWVAGVPRPYCNGHNNRKPESERYTVQDRGYTSPCWVWQISKTTGGYGQTYKDGRLRAAHRVYYEAAKGPIPEGLDLDHLCRVRACINPDHLEPVTRRENLLRGETETAANAAKTHCPAGHVYDAADTYIRPGGQRACKKCNAIRNNARYHHRRAEASR